jgi:hypothetical protein
MNTRHVTACQRGLWFLGVAVLAVGMAVPAYASHIEFSPATITFQSLSQRVIVHLTRNGEPLPASEIGTVKLYIDKHDYDHMITVQRMDGAIVITPTDELQTGRYELYIGSGEHRVMVPMTAPLETIPNSLEIIAARENKTVEQVKIERGFVTTAARHGVSFKLPETYYLGQQVRIPMITPPDHTYTWYIKGFEVAKGTGPHTFTHTFMDEGSYHIGYAETKNGAVVSEQTSFTRAIPEAPVDWQVVAKQEFALKGPGGFDRYAWMVDGNLTSVQPEINLDFDTAGNHTVECFAVSTGANGLSERFRKITYAIAVTNPAGP